MLSKHDSSSESGNTLRIMHCYKQNKLAIIMIYNEQCACRLIVTKLMDSIGFDCNQPNVYQCGKSRTTKAHEYHTLCTTSLNTKLISRNIIENSGGTGRLARSHGTIRRRLAEWRRPIASAFLFTAASQARDIALILA